MRPKDIETIEQMIENNFTIYTYEHEFDDIKEMEFTKRARFVYLREEETDTREVYTQGSNRAGLMNSFRYIDSTETLNYTVLNEKIINELVGIPSPMNHFLFDELNDKVVRLVESGFIEKIIGPEPKTTSDDEPTVLQLKHLSIWFYLGMALLLISLFVFFGELLVAKVMKFRKQKKVKRSKT
jgi:hypothetical protein